MEFHRDGRVKPSQDERKEMLLCESLTAGAAY
jgi:hypothetical protein